MKQGPQWIPAIWLGKIEAEDLHVVATGNGLLILRGKAIRRTSEPWRPMWLFLVQEKPFQLTKQKTTRALRFGAPVTPRPVTDQHPDKQADEVVDYDPRVVLDYSRRHPEDSEDERGEEQQAGGPKREANSEPFTPKKTTRFADEQDHGHGRTEAADSGDPGDSTLLDDRTV